jgi:hypothetical protein
MVANMQLSAFGDKNSFYYPERKEEMGLCIKGKMATTSGRESKARLRDLSRKGLEKRPGVKGLELSWRA